MEALVDFGTTHAHQLAWDFILSRRAKPWNQLRTGDRILRELFSTDRFKQAAQPAGALEWLSGAALRTWMSCSSELSRSVALEHLARVQEGRERTEGLDQDAAIAVLLCKSLRRDEFDELVDVLRRTGAEHLIPGALYLAQQEPNSDQVGWMAEALSGLGDLVVWCKIVAMMSELGDGIPESCKERALDTLLRSDTHDFLLKHHYYAWLGASLTARLVRRCVACIDAEASETKVAALAILLGCTHRLREEDLESVLRHLDDVSVRVRTLAVLVASREGHRLRPGQAERILDQMYAGLPELESALNEAADPASKRDSGASDSGELANAVRLIERFSPEDSRYAELRSAAIFAVDYLHRHLIEL
jgi:hypothetical protein